MVFEGGGLYRVTVILHMFLSFSLQHADGSFGEDHIMEAFGWSMEQFLCGRVEGWRIIYGPRIDIDANRGFKVEKNVLNGFMFPVFLKWKFPHWMLLIIRVITIHSF